MIETQQLLNYRELQGTKCYCGNSKPRGKSFCHFCYHSLPDRLKRDLYKRFGQGYEEALAEAKALLGGANCPA